MTGMQKTLDQYNEQLSLARQLFEAKTSDYGTSWRILRPSSLTDQLLIKARRIRSIQEKGSQQVADPVSDDFLGLVNYGLMALIQLEAPGELPLEIATQQAAELYDKQAFLTRDLMVAKNDDYGEVWRDMRVSSITDLILMKLLRIKQIEDNDGKTTVSEGLAANYMDIVNYAIFALILLHEQNHIQI